jgi:HlyD family secretion protein
MVAIDRAGVPAELVAGIAPGMPADVIIITGERTRLTYLLGPLRNSLAKSMRDP